MHEKKEVKKSKFKKCKKCKTETVLAKCPYCGEMLQSINPKEVVKKE